MNHNIIDLLTKNQPNRVRHFVENLKSSPSRNFAANPEIALQMLTI
jgi:hypothetical protein